MPSGDLVIFVFVDMLILHLRREEDCFIYDYLVRERLTTRGLTTRTIMVRRGYQTLSRKRFAQRGYGTLGEKKMSKEKMSVLTKVL